MADLLVHGGGSVYLLRHLRSPATLECYMTSRTYWIDP